MSCRSCSALSSSCDTSIRACSKLRFRLWNQDINVFSQVRVCWVRTAETNTVYYNSYAIHGDNVKGFLQFERGASSIFLWWFGRPCCWIVLSGVPSIFFSQMPSINILPSHPKKSDINKCVCTQTWRLQVYSHCILWCKLPGPVPRWSSGSLRPSTLYPSAVILTRGQTSSSGRVRFPAQPETRRDQTFLWQFSSHLMSLWGPWL